MALYLYVYKDNHKRYSTYSITVITLERTHQNLFIHTLIQLHTQAKLSNNCVVVRSGSTVPHTLATNIPNPPPTQMRSTTATCSSELLGHTFTTVKRHRHDCEVVLSQSGMEMFTPYTH